MGAVAIAALMSACGDTTPDAPAAGAGTGARDCATHPGAAHTVSIGDFVFDPTPVKVGVCDTVVWTNAHDQAHTSTGKGDKDWSTGNIQPGASSEPVTFEAAGSFTYVCALHPFMHGTVDVS